jgi:hypothetical protein
MSGGRRGGERRRHAPQSACTRGRHERSSSHLGDASFARSFDPCASILTMLPAPKRWKVRRSVWYRGRANLCKQEEPAPGLGRTGGARLAAHHRSRKGDAWCVRQGRRSRPPSLRGSRARVRSSHVVNAVAEVGRRRQVSNKLRKRAPKRAAGRSERGPSSGREWRVKPLLERRAKRRFAESASPVKSRERTGEDPGWREIVIQRFPHRHKRCGGRGAGAVMATGSYEGPLPMEDTPDHRDASAFTRRR